MMRSILRYGESVAAGTLAGCGFVLLGVIFGLIWLVAGALGFVQWIDTPHGGSKFKIRGTVLELNMHGKRRL